MSDLHRQLDSDDQDLPVSETPQAGAPGDPGRQLSARAATAVLGEFSRWLERWAAYVQAWTGLAEGHAASESGESPAAAAERPATQGPPAHWAAAATQGPPAHWLALFEGQTEEPSAASEPDGELEAMEGSQTSREVEPPAASALPGSKSPAELIRRFQAELGEFLAAPLPGLEQAEGESQGSPLDETIPGESAAGEAYAAPGVQDGPHHAPASELADQVGENYDSRHSLEPGAAVDHGRELFEQAGPARKTPSLAQREKATESGNSDPEPVRVGTSPGGWTAPPGESPASGPVAETAAAQNPARVTRIRLRRQPSLGAVQNQAATSPPAGLPASPAAALQRPGRDEPAARSSAPASADKPPLTASPSAAHLRLRGPRSSGYSDDASQSSPSFSGPDAPVEVWMQAADPPMFESQPAQAFQESSALQTLPVLEAPAEPQTPSELHTALATQAKPELQVPSALDAGRSGQSPAPPAEREDASPPAPALPPEPAWLSRPQPAEPQPARWPAAGNSAHWPALPEPLLQLDPGPRPYQDAARRRRIDREQGGTSWNG
jgi:hypothetical protein